MAKRPTMYPEGSKKVSFVLPLPVAEALADEAEEGRQSQSRLLGNVLTMRYQAQGKLPMRPQ